MNKTRLYAVNRLIGGFLLFYPKQPITTKKPPYKSGFVNS